MLSQTRERFALAIVASVPVERIAEIHFFHPMRQGGIESGVAVLAASLSDSMADESPMEGSLSAEPEGSPREADVRANGAARRGSGSDSAAEDCAIIPAHTVEPPELEERDERMRERDTRHASAEATNETAMRDASSDGHETFGQGAPTSRQDEPEIRPAARAQEAHTKYTVYSARYRLVLKGPERGKWEMSMRAEADAPLPTVDAVVRGVLRRAGDAEDAERMSGEELRAQLHAASRT